MLTHDLYLFSIARKHCLAFFLEQPAPVGLLWRQICCVEGCRNVRLGFDWILERYFEIEVTAMKKRLVTTAALVFTLLIASVPIFAHHGNAEFDVGKRVTVKGTVTKWFWANPHCLLSFDAKGDDGSVVHWIAETQPPRSIVPGGFGEYTFKPGDEVTVTLEPVKNGRPVGRILEVVLPDGTKLITGHLD